MHKSKKNYTPFTSRSLFSPKWCKTLMEQVVPLFYRFFSNSPRHPCIFLACFTSQLWIHIASFTASIQLFLSLPRFHSWPLYQYITFMNPSGISVFHHLHNMAIQPSLTRCWITVSTLLYFVISHMGGSQASHFNLFHKTYQYISCMHHPSFTIYRNINFRKHFIFIFFIFNKFFLPFTLHSVLLFIPHSL